MNHLKSLKFKSYPEDNVADLCDTILVDAEHLEIIRDFKPEHLVSISFIFEYNYDSIYCLLEIK